MIGVLATSLAWAAPPACATLSGEHIVSLGIAAHGHRFGGLAIIEFEGEDWSLTALSPAGPALFTVQRRGGVSEVWSAFPEWTPWLARLPFDRDLRLLYSGDPPACAWGEAKIVPCGHSRVWRGAPGPARVRTNKAGGRELRDPWRGYTLTVLESGGAP